jgi:hypothetical protein
VIISCEPEEIAEIIEKYTVDPRRLADLAENGARASRTLFSIDTQMARRLRVLAELSASTGIRGFSSHK